MMNDKTTLKCLKTSYKINGLQSVHWMVFKHLFQCLYVRENVSWKNNDHEIVWRMHFVWWMIEIVGTFAQITIHFVQSY